MGGWRENAPAYLEVSLGLNPLKCRKGSRHILEIISILNFLDGLGVHIEFFVKNVSTMARDASERTPSCHSSTFSWIVTRKEIKRQQTEAFTVIFVTISAVFVTISAVLVYSLLPVYVKGKTSSAVLSKSQLCNYHSEKYWLGLIFVRY